MVLDMQQFTETFCVAPLVFEYLSRQFVAGLPDMRDTENILHPPDRDDATSMDEWVGPEHLHDDGLVGYSPLAKHMQGIWSTVSRAVENTARRTKLFKIWGTTILPGVQFIAVGVITRPESYYKVSPLKHLDRDVCSLLIQMRKKCWTFPLFDLPSKLTNGILT